MTECIQIDTYPVKNVLSRLLKDKATGKNIVYATDYYQHYGCIDTDQITEEALLGFSSIDIQPRVQKAQAEQSDRTRKKAEVFTPFWIVQKMNDHCDTVWQKEKSAGDWKKYVSQRILEITCGEAPFLVTRYDTTTGEPIPLAQRTGMLDRKLHVVNANTTDESTWLAWVVRAFESTYGYEYQGDNLLLARINLLMTFSEYLQDRWNRPATDTELKKIANILSWNLWQMDGLKDTCPVGVTVTPFYQFSFFDEGEPEQPKAEYCKIYNWRSGNAQLFYEVKEGIGNMKFDFVIGNPPYQDTALGDNATYAPPIYHLFMEASYQISDKVELITPARFLFNAGSTPKDWNKKMLNDKHLKVLHFEQDSSKVFSNTDIKGGIAVTYHDETQDFGAIETFTPYAELNSIMKKVVQNSSFTSMSSIAISRTAYRLTDELHKEHPEAITQLSKGHAYDMSTNIFDRLPQVFFAEKPDNDEYIRILGREKNTRVYKFIKRKYVNTVRNLNFYKIFIPKAMGSGTFGELFSNLIVGTPAVGSTETFLSIGVFNAKIEAENALNYMKTKFARAMVGILKTTQDITPEKFKYVPLQDFTEQSDIDWSKSIAEIDQQLYAKYGLSQEEIDFIETHVKEME